LPQGLNKSCFLFLVLLMVSCEDAVIDYASDIVGAYIVETANIDGGYTDYSILPLEQALIIDIGSSDFLSYTNAINLCDSSYIIDTLEIDSFTDTAIVFRDDTRLYYSIEDEQLILWNGDDMMTLVEYTTSFPPASWRDPALLTNDTYEPDSSISLASRISAAGAVQSHYSAVCDDEDYFIFEALDSTTYVIEVNAVGSTGLDLTISLYFGQGDLVDFNDDQSTTDVDPKLEWTCEGTGEYYFIVKKYWDYLDPGNSEDDKRGAYTVQVDVTKDLLNTSPQNVIKKHRPIPNARRYATFFD